MMRSTTPLTLVFLCSAATTLASPVVWADSFVVTHGETLNQPQTLTDGQAGMIRSGGALSLPGNTSRPAVTVSGATRIDNAGQLTNAGKGRAIDGGDDVTLRVNNQAGARIGSTHDDAIKLNHGADSALVDNHGTLRSGNADTAGGQAIDFNDVVSGRNTLINHTGATAEAYGSDAVRPGAGGIITNAGTIQSFNVAGDSSGNDAIDAKKNSGVRIANRAGGRIEGAHHGITGGNTDTKTDGNYSLSVVNRAGGTIRGDDGSGINIDGFNGNEVVTVRNGGLISGGSTTGDGDGIDVDGLVRLNNTGTIESRAAYQDNSEGVTVGGGRIVNSGTIIGKTETNGASRGITLAGLDKNPDTDQPIPTEGIFADTSVVNSGLIRGMTGAAIAVPGAGNTHTLTISNRAGGTLEGGGQEATVFTGANPATITNRGRIVADRDGAAVDLGSGDSTLRILGGRAAVTGNITGGSGRDRLEISPGQGHRFAYRDDVTHFSELTIGNGTTVLDGQNTDIDAVQVKAGRLIVGSNSTAGARLSAPMTVGDGATLAGNGTLGATTVRRDGTLAPGDDPHDIGTLKIARSLRLNGTLALDVASAARHDVLDVDGLASFGPNSRLNLDLLPQNSLRVGDTLDVLLAHGFDHLARLDLTGLDGYRFGLADVGLDGRDDRALRLTVESVGGQPVPAPSGLGLFGLGLLLIGGSHWRARRVPRRAR